MPKPIELTRRTFLKHLGVVGGGIIVSFSIGTDVLSAIRQPLTGAAPRGLPTDFNAFLEIGANNKVTCYAGKAELGQGTINSIAQLMAEELDVPFDAINMILGDTDLCPWDMGTFGSMTIRFFGPPARMAAAKARSVLLDLASEHMKIPREKLETKNGSVFEKSRKDNSITYGELTQGKLIMKEMTHAPTLKKPADFNVIGRTYDRRDGLDKVTGKAKYGGDIRLPGMLYAKILRPPAHGVKLKGLDTSKAEAIPGVQVIKEKNLTTVLHELPDMAEHALSLVKAEFTTADSTLDNDTIFDHLIKNAPPGNVESEAGKLETGQKEASTIVKKVYYDSYTAHAPIETHTSTAGFDKGRLTIWSSTQRPFGIKDQVANVLKLKRDNIRVITTYVGGGFGGKSSNLEALEAAILAKRTGKPVQVSWSREEEFFNDTFKPAAVVNITSGINNKGRITFWDYDVLFAGSDGANVFYDIPHHSAKSHGGWMRSRGVHPFNVGAWRAPGTNTNTFARESQIDLMAVKAGMDPFTFRIRNLKDKKMIGVLEKTAEIYDWKNRKKTEGTGFGMACSIRSGTYVAMMAEVEVDKKSKYVDVKRVVTVQNMGLCIDPEGAKMQMEGCIMMGLGYALFEEVRFKDGKILDTNFDTYEIPMFSRMPEIKTHIIKADSDPAQGGGEPGIVCMGAILANAVFDATGVRVYHLPITPERIKKALNSQTI